MPPFSATRSYAPVGAPGSPTPPASLPAARVFEHRKDITKEYDQATDQTRVSVTTHNGTYFLWIQRPRLTFFFVYAGVLAQMPGSVFLIFRTQDPQLPLNNRLAFVCDGTRQELGITPTFWLEPGAMTTTRHYMYELPLTTFAEFVACGDLSIALGGVNAPFVKDQREALRDFGSRMGGQ
jgi:hypothetical protein